MIRVFNFMGQNYPFAQPLTIHRNQCFFLLVFRYFSALFLVMFTPVMNFTDA